MAGAKSLKGKVHFGIITIRGDEYKEVLAQLAKTSPVDGNDERRYRVASLKCLDGSEVVIAVTRCIEQGNVEAQKAASGLVQDLDPQWILVVGIAGGVPDSDFSLGDVVVSSRVYDLTIEAAKLGGEREYSIKGGDLHQLARRVVQDIPGMLSGELADWHHRVEMERPELDLEALDERLKGDEEWRRKVKESLMKHFSQARPPLVVPGAIASSDRMIKDPEITATWKGVARRFVAVEMELAGTCRATEKLPVLGIRGISDIVGLQRDEVWTTYACRTAATFAISLIRSGLMPLKRPATYLRPTETPKDWSNPFILKTPVWGGFFFGRDELLRRIFNYLIKGQSVSLVGERRTGKTSILLRIRDLKAELLSRPEQHVFALVNIQGLAYRSDADIWVVLLSALLAAMNQAGLKTEATASAIKQLKLGEPVLLTLLELFRTLTHDGVKVTFLFDEFEDTAQTENPVIIGFYRILRNLAQDEHIRLTYVIATRLELNKVERSLKQQFTALSSPLFNIFHQLIIKPFSEDEAREMVFGLLQSANLAPSTIQSFWQQRNLLLELSGFHPFCLQMACNHLFGHCVRPDGAFADPVPKDKVFSAFLDEADSHFSYLWEVSSVEEREFMTKLALRGDDIDVRRHRQTIRNLENRCLILRDKEAKSGWRLFSSALVEWIRERQLTTLTT